MRQLLLSLFLSSIAIFSYAADSSVPKRAAKVIALTGKATALKADGSSVPLKVGDEFPAGSTLKTEENATVDLFFRRIGSIVELEPGTTLKIDKLEMEMKNGKLVKRTELSLKEGGVYACVRVMIPDSKIMVRTPKTVFHVPGTGMGRFQFGADGSALVGRRSKLTLIADTSGELDAVQPGQLFNPKTTNAVTANPSFFEKFTVRMDALQKTASELTPPPVAEDMP